MPLLDRSYFSYLWADRNILIVICRYTLYALKATKGDVSCSAGRVLMILVWSDEGGVWILMMRFQVSLCSSCAAVHACFISLELDWVYLILDGVMIKVAWILEGDMWEQCWVFYFCINLFQFFYTWVLHCKPVLGAGLYLGTDFCPHLVSVYVQYCKTYSARSCSKSDGEDVFCGGCHWSTSVKNRRWVWVHPL